MCKSYKPCCAVPAQQTCPTINASVLGTAAASASLTLITSPYAHPQHSASRSLHIRLRENNVFLFSVSQGKTYLQFRVTGKIVSKIILHQK